MEMFIEKSLEREEDRPCEPDDEGRLDGVFNMIIHLYIDSCPMDLSGRKD